MSQTDARAPLTVVYAFLDFDDGGAQRLMLRVCRDLDPAGFRPRIVCLRRRGVLADAASGAGIPVHALGRLRRPFDLGAVPVLARWLRDARADVLHVSLYSRAAPYARLAARLAGVPLTVAHEHCRAVEPGRPRRWADRLLAPGTCFVAVSEADRSHLVRAGVSPAAVHVIHPGIDVDRFAPRGADPARRLAARAALGLDRDRPTVLVPARLHPMKRHVDLLAALPDLAARVPDVLVLCAGGGPLERALTALAASAGLAGHVRFLGSRDDMPDLLSAADAVALPSRAEGMPAALVEAMVAGRCVVATAVGGVPEIVADGATGRLVPPSDTAALARALAEVLADPAAREAMAARAGAWATGRFGMARATREMERIYRTAGRRGHGPAIWRAAPGTDRGLGRWGTPGLGR